jgi:hypothetical protein
MPPGLPPVFSPIWTSVFNIIDNSWIGRVWIVQESELTLGLGTRSNFHASRKNISAWPGEGTHELVSRGCLVDDISQIYERIPIALDFLRRDKRKIDTTEVLEAYLHLREFERSIAKT